MSAKFSMGVASFIVPVSYTHLALVESVFSIDGLGIYLMESCESMDVYGISGAILVCAVLFVLFNTVADILSSMICPAYRRKRV